MQTAEEIWDNAYRDGLFSVNVKYHFIKLLEDYHNQFDEPPESSVWPGEGEIQQYMRDCLYDKIAKSYFQRGINWLKQWLQSRTAGGMKEEVDKAQIWRVYPDLSFTGNLNMSYWGNADHAGCKDFRTLPEASDYIKYTHQKLKSQPSPSNPSIKQYGEEDMCQAFTAGQFGLIFLDWLKMYKLK